MLMFHVAVNMKRLGIRFKQLISSDSESTLSLRDNNFIRVHFRYKTLQDVFVHLELCYTLQYKVIYKNP